MLRTIQFVILVLGLALVALTSAIVTMRMVIHGAEVKIPSFQGLTAPEAFAKAASLDVEMTVDSRFYSAEVPADRILSQSPAVGTVVRREWHVRCIESLGPQTVAIPNLVGQPQRSAIIQLRRLGFQVGSIVRLPLANSPPETVLAQDPPAGAADVESPSVALVLSDLTRPDEAAFVMPDLTGRLYFSTVVTLTRAGLKLAPVIEVAATTVTQGQEPPLPGSVIAQVPAAGYGIDTNTPIQLTVVR